jgi:hypothetical protein
MPKRPLKIDPIPGTLLAIPLSRGGFGAAIIVRSKPVVRKRFRVILTFGFDQIWKDIPSLDEVAALPIEKVINVTTGGDISARDGRWTVIGIRPGFDSKDWPVPPQIQPGVSKTYSIIPDASVRLIYLTNGALQNGRVLPNDGLIDPKNEPQFPYATGLGDRSYLEGVLDRAIRDRVRLHTVTVLPSTPALWRSVNRKATRRGLLGKQKRSS